MTDLEQLLQLLRKNSLRYGDFTLASGQKSNVYVDARLTTLRAEAMPLIGRAFLAKFRERGWEPSAVGGLTMGAATRLKQTLMFDLPIVDKAEVQALLRSDVLGGGKRTSR